MQWEYKIVHLDGGGYIRDAERPTEFGLNDLGDDGWELAASLNSSGIKLGGRGGSTTALVFKRPRDETSTRSTERSTGTGQ